MAKKYIDLAGVGVIAGLVKESQKNFVKNTDVASGAKAGLVKIGAGIAVAADGTISVKSDIEASSVDWTGIKNVPTGSKTVKGIVKVGTGINVDAEGTISVVHPTKVSELTNDSKFQTEDQVKNAIAAVVNGAPEALDTLKEIADIIDNDDDTSAGILQQLAKKANSADVESTYVKKSDYATDKQATDNALANVYTKSQVYTKTEVDTTFVKDADLVALTRTEIEGAWAEVFNA